ncbi:MAG: UDP-4-amino-4,6-dideoxy-N-acetyl-beta-L-altrosamine transaminase [Candidatus Altiarchaeota archaeon]|nr:UDP-4-amino-4,6-dideoxy-N-acetyl-beta-L-altrosamine transaminase [Candidatus Altiarchaeota archaeon]
MNRVAKELIPYGLHDIGEDDIAAVVSTLRSEWLTGGPMVREFEEKLSSYLGCKHSVAVCNGTAALDIAVQSLELPKGSEIITTPFTFVASSNAILFNGCRPVFADINKETRNIDPESVREKITEKTKAILYVDYAGHPCDIKALQEISEEHELYLIEDVCHALGAEYRGKRLGCFADLSIFSFHPVKHITTGEGGAVVTDSSELYERMLLLRNHGIDRDASSRQGKDAGYVYDMKFLGRNYRITDFQCALGVSQLRKLDVFLERRRDIAGLYGEFLGDVGFVELPHAEEDVKHAWHLYTVLLRVDRDKFFNYMRHENIGVNVHYIPVYRHSFYAKSLGVKPKDFPVTEDVFRRIVTLPLYPKMSDDNVEYICSKTKDYIG